MRAVAVLALIVALAGCITLPNAAQVEPAGAAGAPGAFVPPIPEFDWTSVVDPDHASHQLPALHTGGHGLKLVGHAALGDIIPPTHRGSITQVDVWQNYAVVSGMEGGLAFAIVDITDPAAPKAVSWWPSVADGWTARFSDDGNYVFYGCQMLGAPYVTTSIVLGTCEDPTAPHLPGQNVAGVVVVDVSDKAAPKFVHFLPVGGSHNLYAVAIDGVDYVFTASTAILKFDREAQELVQVAEVPGVHDATVAKHPLTGDWLLFTGTGQLSIYNVNDPTQPQLVYEGEGSEGWTGWHEQTLIPGVVDGRVILAVAGETFVSPTGVPDRVFFLDVTDPANPTLLSEWAPPFSATLPWAGYLYSVHEMAATPTGQVAVAWYHAGIWVLDVSTQERQESPATLAAYLPHELPNVVPATFAQTAIPVVPFVWGAGWDARGYLVVPDMHTGLYMLEPAYGLVPAVDSGQ
ncbi:MAG TPA: hypothetical protein VFH78_14270 [Candidatus Thermoplasmatota archaeon]|nr:hypothetical protein [Candidatus Thermoplasmatota archaeon]